MLNSRRTACPLESDRALHVPFAAWAALVSLLVGGGPTAALPPCEPPTCVPVAHAFLMSPPVLVATDGQAIEWRAENGRHYLTESSGPGGCLDFALDAAHPSERVAFTSESGSLFALHRATGNATRSAACAGAIELPGGAWVVRYQCALHAREGGVGLVIVAPG